jgi:hypothetical protein
MKKVQATLFKLDKYKVGKAIDGILHGFDWNKTKQKSKYWNDVIDNLQEIEKWENEMQT